MKMSIVLAVALLMTTIFLWKANHNIVVLKHEVELFKYNSHQKDTLLQQKDTIGKLLYEIGPIQYRYAVGEYLSRHKFREVSDNDNRYKQKIDTDSIENIFKRVRKTGK